MNDSWDTSVNNVHPDLFTLKSSDYFDETEPTEDSGALQDISGGFKEASEQTLGGLRDGAVESVKSLSSLVDYITEYAPQLNPAGALISKGLGVKARPVADKLDEVIPEVDEAETVTGGIIRGTAQFVPEFLGVGKFMKAAGFAHRGGRMIAAGAVTDAAAFDPNEERLSNLVQEFPELQNPVTEFLAAKDSDSEAVGRLKNSLEGAGLGFAVEGILRSVKYSTKASGLPDAVKGKVQQLADQKLLKETLKTARSKALNLIDIDDSVVTKNLEILTDNKGAIGKDLDKVTKEISTTEAELRALAKEDPEAQKVLKELLDETVEPQSKSRPYFKLSEEQTDKFIQSVKDGNTSSEGLDFNFERVRSNDDVLKTINSMSKTISSEMDKAKGGIRSHKQTEELAELLGESPEELTGQLQKTFDNIQNIDSVMVSTRTYLHSLGKKVHEHAIKFDSRNATEKEINDFVNLINLHANTQSMLKGVQTNVARGLNSQKINVGSTMDLNALDVDEVMNTVGGRKKLQKMARVIVAADGDEKVISKVLNNPIHTRVLNAGIEYWINSLLSSKLTHAVNMSSNAVTALYHPLEKMGAGVLSADKAQVHGAVSMYAGMFDALKDSFFLVGKTINLPDGGTTKGSVWKSLIKGDNILDPQHSIDDIGMHSISAQNFGAKGMLGHTINGFGNVVRLPTRMLATEDELFKALSYRGELKRITIKEAYDRSLKGKEFSEFVNKSVTNPSREQHIQALEHARVATFTNDLAEGTMSKSLQGFVSKHPMARLVVPFIRTPVNIMKFVGHRSSLLSLASKTIREELKNPQTRAMAMSKIGMSTAGWYGAFDLALSDRITGGGEQRTNKSKRQAGWQPYSIKWTDEQGVTKYTAYNRADPFGMFLGLAADFTDIYGKLDDDSELDEAVIAMTTALAKNLTSKTYLQGITQFMNALSEPDRNVERYIRSQTSALVPNALNDIRKEEDPYMREVQTLFEAIKNKLPEYSKDLPPRRNIWGDAIKYPKGLGEFSMSPFATTTESDDPVNKEVMRLGMSVNLPSYRISDNVELTPQQRDRFIVLAGKEIRIDGKDLKETLRDLIKSPDYNDPNIPDGNDDYESGRVSFIRSIITRYRQLAKQQLFAEDSELQEAVMQDKETKLQYKYGIQ